VSRGWRRCD